MYVPADAASTVRMTMIGYLFSKKGADAFHEC
jgi:hypothetical protein